jgi:hypothetical protein
MRLDHRPHLDQVVERDVLPAVVRVERACGVDRRGRAYERAATRRDLDEAALDEAAQRLSDERPAHA